MNSEPTKNFGYLVDSSWYKNLSEGKKYHIRSLLICGSICGHPVLNDSTAKDWDTIPDVLKCKCCQKILEAWIKSDLGRDNES